jgi:hypothetical protein
MLAHWALLHQMEPLGQTLFAHIYNLSVGALRKIWVQRLTINRIGAILIENVPIINILEVDIMNDVPSGAMVLLNGYHFLSLPEQLQFGNFIYVYVFVPIL